MVDLTYILTVIFIFFLQCTFGNITRVDPLVNTNVGLIKGLKATDGDYSMFLGIPYAKVDKRNPFGASIPSSEFNDVFEAYYESDACPQVNDSSNEPIGNLNCLSLNVYVPNSASAQNKIPVMVWIHGGFFRRGDAARLLYGPKYLVKQNIILVTIQYRLGPYGFMCLDIPEVPGNQGMKDQLTALRWVKNNIQVFGGDINKITIFGESAGGSSVDLHLLSVQDKLYNNVIIQSGSSLAATVLHTPDRSAPIKLSEQLGYVTDSITDALNFLAKTDTDLVIAASAASNIMFKPCTEQEFENTEPFIIKPWTNAPMPKVKSMPILIGFNNKERMFEYENRSPDFFESLNVFEDNLANIFSFNETKLREMKSIVQRFYIGDNEISQELKSEIGDFDSDFTYIHPIHRSVKKYIENSAKNVFLYMFSYSGKRNLMKHNNNISAEGAAHADEIGYLFDPISLRDEPDPNDKIMIDRMTTMWTNFAKYNDPTPDTSELLPVKWTSLTDDKWSYLNIDFELSLKSRPLSHRMAFWDLFYKLNEKYQIGYEENI